MGNLLFGFGGRIGPADFQKAAIVLIVISAILSLLPLINMSLSMLGIVGLILIWPWIAIWTKRYHDAGKSGWMMLVPFVVMIILSIVASQVVNVIAPIDTSAAEAAAASGDFMAIIQSSLEAAKPQILPSTVGNVIVSLAVVFVFNSMIKSDPEENRFGPATN